MDLDDFDVFTSAQPSSIDLSNLSKKRNRDDQHEPAMHEHEEASNLVDSHRNVKTKQISENSTAAESSTDTGEIKSLSAPLVRGPPAKIYSFKLDTFQQEAVDYIENGESVLVAAHTSAGNKHCRNLVLEISSKNILT